MCFAKVICINSQLKYVYAATRPNRFRKRRILTDFNTYNFSKAHIVAP